MAGLETFDEKLILIAGGYDKNLDYTPLGRPILDKVKTLILLGSTSNKIKDAVLNEKTTEDIEIIMCHSLEETINIAKEHAKFGDIILFSPASASFDMFKNFADRGIQFKQMVNNLEK